MRETKDSNIKWVGAIPSTWTTELGKHFMTCLDRPVREDDGVITCFRDGEVTLRSKRREEGFTVSFQEIGYQGIEPGDLVVHGMDGFAGAIGISDSRGKATPVLNVLDTEQDKRYMMYALRNMAYTDVFLALSTGIRVRSCDTSWKKLRSLEYALPPLDEQRKIADKIEQKSKQVDALIANQQAQIEKLKQYKQSLITEVVTKGLDPNAPMKESGVEWIGAIPQSWSIYRLKYVCKVRDGLVDPRDPQYGQLPHIGPGNIEKFTGRLTDYNLVEEEQLISGKYVFNEHDLVYGKINPQLGKVAYPRFKGLCSADAYAIISNESMVLPEFLQLWFLSRPFIDRTILESLRMGMPKINRDDLMKLEIAIPSIEEQKRIIEHYASVDKDLSRLIAIKEEKAKKLDDYKKSLIYEYVTGKKEVS